jgi:hypothetical protein
LLNSIENKQTEDKINSIAKLMEPRVFISKEIGELDNIYTSCDGSSNQCKDKKLIISQEKFDTFCELLANDLENREKKYLVHKITSGIIDSLNFTNYKDEILYLEL